MSDLFVEISDVMFDDVGQLLDLHWFIIKYRLPLAEQSQLLQLGVGVGDVSADALGNVDELGVVTNIPRHGAVHLSSSQTGDSVPELSCSVSTAAAHHHADQIFLKSDSNICSFFNLPCISVSKTQFSVGSRVGTWVWRMFLSHCES